MRCGAVTVVLVLWAATVWAQAAPGPQPPGSAAGLRGLTAGEIDELREGRGMGLARAAELHGYPGPRHVLDAAAAGQLHLAPEQRAAVERVFADMAAEARQLGTSVLTEEEALEAALRDGRLTEADLLPPLERLATLRARLRAVHLRAHLRTRALLTDHQVARYAELRGYGAGALSHSH